MKRRVLALVLALIMVLGTSVIFAENPEGATLKHKVTGVTYEVFDVLFDFDLLFDVAQNLSDYIVEVDGNWYDAQEVEDKFLIDPEISLEDAVEGLDVYMPGALEVLSITAINATQVEVEFSAAVDQASVFQIGSLKNGVFEFVNLDPNLPLTNDVDGDTSTGELSEDGKTLTITANAGKVFEGRYQIITSGIKTEDGRNIEDYNEVVNLGVDTTAPTISSVDRISSNRLTIKFSEPVSGGTISAKYADNTLVGGPAVVAATVTAGATKLDIDLSDNAVTVNKDIKITLNGVTDMNGNLISPQPSIVTVFKLQADGIEPGLVSVTQIGAKTFNIKFSKDLVGLPFSADGVEVDVSGPTVVTAISKVSASEYKVTTDVNLDGLLTVTVPANKAVDLDGQDNTVALTKLVTFIEDTVAPKATSQIVKISGQEYIQLTFDKDVELKGNKGVKIVGTKTKDYVTSPQFSLNNVTTAYKNAANKKVILVPLTNPQLLEEGAEYNLTLTNTDGIVHGIVSEAGQAMDPVNAIFIRGKDDTPPNTDVVALTSIAKGSDNNKVDVTFDKPVDGASAINVANYTVDGAIVESVTLKPAGATQVAVLNLKADSNTFSGVRNITVKNVKALGSTVAMTTDTKIVDLDENVRPTVTTAQLIANDTIKLTFSEAVITSNVATDFELLIGGVVIPGKTVLTTAAHASPGVTTVELTLTGSVTAADVASGLSLKALSGIDIVDDAGNGGNDLLVPTNIIVSQ